MRRAFLCLLLLVTASVSGWGQSKVYWTVDTAGLIRNANLDGSNRQTILNWAAQVPGWNTSSDYAVDVQINPATGKLYFLEKRNSVSTVRLIQANLDGTNPQSIYSSTNYTMNAYVLDLAHSRIVFAAYDNVTSPFGTAIFSMGLDGASPTKLVASTGTDLQTTSIAVNAAGDVAYLNGQYSYLYSVNLTSGVRSTLLNGTSLINPCSLLMDGTNLYISDYGAYAIFKYPTGGGPLTTVVSGLADVDHIALDPLRRTLHYATYSQLGVGKISADGTGQADPGNYITGESGNTEGVAIYLGPAATTNSASSVASSGATLNGSVQAGDYSTTVTFDYGTSASYGSSINATPGTATGTGSTSVSASLSSLSSSTTYHFRVKAVSTGGTAYGSDQTFTTPAGVPTVTGVSPSSGPTSGSNSVTITGTNFTGATAVKFGSTNASSYTVNGATQITATAPAGSVGTVDIIVTTAGGTSATSSSDQYTYVAAPTVTGVSPSSGPTSSGTTVTITGTILTGATAVKFGSTNASSYTVNSATQITAAAPAGSAGTVDITVTTAGGTSATSSSDQYTYVAAPAVTGVSPSSGPTSGGTTVTITGTTFTGATAVKFGSTNASSYTVNSATQITATAPAGSAGTVDITVTTIGGTSATSSSDQYTHVAAPTVTGVSPSSGPTAGGTSVTVTGTGLTAATAVKFGSSNASSYTVNSATQITATAPAGSAGTVDITVTTAGGTSATSGSDSYTYVTAPTVTGVSPTSGPTGGGTTVTITGTTLTGATAVKFGSTNASSYTVNSASQITATAPAGSAGTVDITVTTAGGTSVTSSSDQYTYVAAPTVTGVSPSSGPTGGGTTVTITGTNLAGASSVSFGGTNATIGSNTGTSMSVTAPAGSAGTIDVTVTTAGGTSATSSSDHFTYVAAPTVTSISPSSGPTGGTTSVTLSGTNFTGATTVRFGSTNATSYTVNSAIQITATAPAGAVGTVDITVTTVGGTSATSSVDQYTYIAAPTVTGISPSNGSTAGGTSVVITGTNFGPATAVKFGTNNAIGFTVNAATQITATSPAGSAGTVDITVINPGGTSATTSSDQFTYVPAPAISSISPSSGPAIGGTSVVITGTNFTGTTSVKFGVSNATSYTVNSPTQITATSPSGAAGTVDITVTTAIGTSSTGGSDQFTYVAAPTVSSISPSSGPIGGTTSVILTGTNLTGATAVKFGSTNATSYTVNSATQITATAPAGAAGTVDVTVTTVGGTSATGSADQYTYIMAPGVTSISPTSGSTLGGTSVVITGSNFSSATAVKFGSINASSYTVNSATQITAVSPAGSPGSVDIKVTNPGGTSATSSADQFTYVLAPTITGVAPSSGPVSGGTSVVITGTTLTGATAVKFGSTGASAYTVNGATQITATAPAGSAGTVDITVVTSGGASATGSSDQFTYVAPPVVTGLSVSAGLTTGGTSVVITGTNLTGTTAVKFGTTNAASFSVNSATQITATSPAGSMGTVDVTVTTVGGTSATGSSDRFGYYSLPTVATGSASSVTTRTAILAGTVGDNGANTTITFEYGTSTSYGSSINANPANLSAGTGSTAVNASLSGLASNTSYHFRIKAVNAAGTTNGSDAIFTTAIGVPDAPVINSAVAGDSQATIAFSAPTDNGGSAITAYTLTALSDGVVTPLMATTSPITVTGLTNHKAYTFTMTATNAMGTSSASLASDNVIPSPGGSVLIVEEAGGYSDVVANLSRRCSDGHHLTVTTWDTSAQALPASLGMYDQIWDLRADKALSAAEEASYLAYLQNGGLLTLLGEDGSFGVSRNASLVPFVKSLGEGDAIALHALELQPETLQAPFTGPAPGSSVTYVASGCWSNWMYGSPVSLNDAVTPNLASAMVWVPGTLSHAPAGELLTILDVNFLESSRKASFGAMVDNLLNYQTRLSTSSPVIASVEVPSAGVFKAGSALTFTVHTSAAVTVAGTPVLPLTLGGNAVLASYVGGSQTDALVFAYNVQAGDNGVLGVGSTLDLTHNLGSTLRDAEGFPARVDLHHVAATTGVIVDTTAPLAPTLSGLSGRIVTGTAEAKSTVSIYLGSTLLGTVVADASGQWTYTLPVNDVGTLTFTTTDVAGNTSALSAGTAVDTSVPTAHDVSVTVMADSADNSITLDVRDATATSITLASGASHGTATVAGIHITYTPTAGYCGSDSFTYMASNANGSSNAATVSITIKANQPPVLSVDTLFDGAVTASVLLNVSGSVSSANGLSSLMLDGVAVNVLSNGRFSVPVRLKVGANTISLIATDRYGLTTTILRTVTLDTAAPTLVLSSLVDGAVLLETLQTVSGTVAVAPGTETSDSVVSVTFSLNGGAAQTVSLSNGAFSFPIDLVSGLNTLALTATTSAGKTAQVFRSLTLSSSGEALTVTDPAQDLLLTANQYKLKGSVVTMAPPVNVVITVGGQTYTPTWVQLVDPQGQTSSGGTQAVTTGTFEQLIPLAALQSWSVVVTATDAQNHTETVVRNLVTASSTSAALYTMADALRALQIANGLITATAEDLAKYDLAPYANGASTPDGVITLEDAALVLWLAAGQNL